MFRTKGCHHTPFLKYRPLQSFSFSLLFKFKFSNSKELETMRLVQNGKVVEQKVSDFIKFTEAFSKVHIDLGTGDGKFVYKSAQQNPSILFIGIDTNPERMRRMSWKICRKPSRGGGIKNAAFVCSSVESLPTSFTKVADCVSIHFPWSSLLKSLVKPESLMLKKIVHLSQNEANIEIFINYTIFKDNAYRHSLGLPNLNSEYLSNKMLPEYKASGILVKKWEIEKFVKNRTTWGQKLVLGGDREVLFLSGNIHRFSTHD